MKQVHYSFLVLCLLWSVGPLAAQDTSRVSAEPWRTVIDPGTQMILDDGDLTQRLISGSGIFVINPELDYDVDENKLYLDPEFRPYAITLVGGMTDTLLARIQLVDQVVEVIVDGRDLQVDGKSLRSLTAEDGRRFVSTRLPLKAGEPAPLAEVLFESGVRKLYAYRRVEWREPSYQRTSYDSDKYAKRLYRSDLVYLVSPHRSQPVKKLKDLIELLPAEERDEAQRYAKRERLRNREEDYVKLLSYLDRSE